MGERSTVFDTLIGKNGLADRARRRWAGFLDGLVRPEAACAIPPASLGACLF